MSISHAQTLFIEAGIVCDEWAVQIGCVRLFVLPLVESRNYFKPLKIGLLAGIIKFSN